MTLDEINALINNDKLSSMMKQYLECKKNYLDCILLYRLGDFYEMFYSDSEIAANALELTKTSRNCGLEERAPMCGVPAKSLDTYVSKLASLGYKVAIAEQLEDPKKTKNIVKRDIIRVVTPGTVDDFTDTSTSNFLMSIFLDGDNVGISYIDISIGDIFTTKTVKSHLFDEISKIRPSEIIFNDLSLKSFLNSEIVLNKIYTNDTFDNSYLNIDILNEYFKNSYIDSLDLDETNFMKNSLAILLNYILYTEKKVASNITSISVYNSNDYLKIDSFSRDNLELTKRVRTNDKYGSLFYILDKTNTAMGSRNLRRMIEEPLVDKSLIEERLNFVEELVNDFSLSEDLSNVLKSVYDMERLCGKIALERINPREVINLKKSIEHISILKHSIDISGANNLKKYIENLDCLEDIFDLIDKSILDDPETSALEGNIIKSSYNVTLAKYRDTLETVNDKLLKLEEDTQNKTGIKAFKIKNNSDGYFIEATKNQLNGKELPSDFKKVRDLSTSIRYSFDELRTLELEILEASEKSSQLEYELFVDIRSILSENIGRIKNTAKILSNIDVFLSLSKVARDNKFIKPNINEDGVFELKDSRHPVIEVLSSAKFIPNNLYMDRKNEVIHIITGPNMAGKSTFMRQAVLINILAQIGSFVPCTYANIPIRDRIFTRIGANDNLIDNESTFMVEMKEVSNILNNATSKSFVILDEVGRGTSTYDGISLAKSIVLYIDKNIKCQTLFATHYFELTDLEKESTHIKNYSVLVKEDKSDIEFLRKIVKGSADKSYGIFVAKKAGIPKDVIDDASVFLKELESESFLGKTEGSKNIDSSSIYEDSDIKEFLSLDLMGMTIMEMGNYLYNLQCKLKKKGDRNA